MADAEILTGGLMDLAAEQAVLGSMLIDARCVPTALQQMRVDDFQTEVDRKIFGAFRKLSHAHKVMDPVTVLGLLSKTTTEADDVALRSYVLQLMDRTPTAANLDVYIPEAKEKTQLAKLRVIGEKLAKLRDLSDGLPFARQIEQLVASQDGSRHANMEQALVEFYEDLDRVPEYLHWGFPFLDRELFVEPGDFIVLGGRPSAGKTALAICMGYAQSAPPAPGRKQYRVGFFSLETSRKKLVNRLISAATGIGTACIKRRTLTGNDYQILADEAETMRGHTIEWIDAAGMTVEEIEATALSLSLDVIYIDYLQLISAPRRQYRTSRVDEVSDISRSLANMARVNGITVVALSQLSRPQEKGKTRMPVLSDLRESGQIEQDADAVLFIWRMDEQSNDAQRYLSLAKNKEGSLWDWYLAFNGETQRFIPERSGVVPLDEED